MSELITYSEIFRSLQGEGMYTGKNTLWLRLFGCPLQCEGFGQKDPTNPATYELPYKEFDPVGVKCLEDLPVWKFGCDSSYSFAKKFKHLNHTDFSELLAIKLMALLRSEKNPQGTFLHDHSNIETHLCFTGGEPLLPVNQKAIASVINELGKYPGGIIPGTNKRKENNYPRYVTFETNGTQKLTPQFTEFLNIHSRYTRFMFSVSPKLFTVSGEKNAKAIKPDNVFGYQQITDKGQLKFVLGLEDRQWKEMEQVTKQFRDAGVTYPVYIMPVSALVEDQEKIAAQVCDRALSEGYHVAPRVHCYVYGNSIGT